MATRKKPSKAWRKAKAKTAMKLWRHHAWRNINMAIESVSGVGEKNGSIISESEISGNVSIGMAYGAKG